MIPAISDYLKSTLGNNTLSDFVQPDKIAAAGLFLLLNLIDIILIQDNFNSPLQRLANYFFGLNPALQALLAAAIILTLAYLLLSFNSALYKLLTGESWMDSLLGQWLSDRQKRVRDRLLNASNLKDQVSLLKRQRLTTSFAREKEYVYPTSLGNVQNATASYIWHHYGIDMAALWPHMDSILSKADEALAKRIDNEKATLDFLVNMTFLLVVFAIELIVQSFGLMTRWNVLWSIIPFILAWITYVAAINKARAWGDVVQMAFDIHRDDLRGKLSVRPFTSVEDEREVWQQVSSLFLWGEPADDVFVIGAADSKSSSPSDGGSSSGSKTDGSNDKGKNSSGKGASSNGKSAGKSDQQAINQQANYKILSNPENVQVELQSTVVTLDIPQYWPDSPPNVLQTIDQYIEYLLVVTVKEAQSNGQAHVPGQQQNKVQPTQPGTPPPAAPKPPHVVLLAVSDPRLHTIYKVPEYRVIPNKQLGQSGDDIKPEATILGDPGMFNSQGQIIWTIIPPTVGTTIAFRYRLPSHSVFTAIIREKKKLRIEEEQTSSNVEFIPDSGPATSNNAPMSKETFCTDTGTIDYQIVFKANDKTIEEGAMLEIYDSRLSQLSAKKYGCLWLGNNADLRILHTIKLSSPNRYLWSLPKIEKDTLATLTYTV